MERSDMLNELISIVVPVYNIAEYLPRSMKSISLQRCSHLEIIAVDDGSTDDSLRVLEALAEREPRLRVLHQENGGAASARLTGVAAAKGDWIGFVDGDDVIEPDMYARLLANAQQYHADISHCGYQMVFPSRVDYYYNTGRLVRQDRQSGLKDLIEGSFIEPGLWNKLFRRSLFHGLLQSGEIDFSVENNEDLLMNYYLFREADSAVYEDFCPYHYILRSNSAATAKLNEHKLRDPLLVLKTIREDCKADPVLLHAVNSRIAGCLVGLATLPRGEQEALVSPYRAQARRELRRLTPELIRGDYSRRTKLHAAWASCWPGSYSLAHKVYARLRGTDKKYEVQ